MCGVSGDSRLASDVRSSTCRLSHEMLVQVIRWLPIESLPSYRRVSQGFRASSVTLFEREPALIKKLSDYISNLLKGLDDKRVRVMVRLRPHHDDAADSLSVQRNSVSLSALGTDTQADGTSFFFNKVFDSSAAQSDVWGYLASPVMRCLLRREHCCLLAYGQTGSGKTHTMFGDADVEINVGVAYRAVSAIGRWLQRCNCESVEASKRPPNVEFSFLEVYNEKVYDLLADQRPLPLRVDRKVLTPASKYTNAVYSSEEIVVPVGLTRRKVDPLQIEAQVRGWLSEGAVTRTVGKTVFNQRSSRSHAIATLHIMWPREDIPDHDQDQGLDVRRLSSSSTGNSVATTSMAFRPPARVSKARMEIATPLAGTEETRLYLVDLAGSERAGKYALSDQQLKEGVNINKSLSTLGRVVGALARGRGEHVPFRDATLTWLLSDAITGRNARAFMVANVHPAHPAETLSTLRYAQQYSALQSDVSSKIPKLAAAVRNFGRELEGMRFRFTSMLQSLNCVWNRDSITRRVVSVRRNAQELFIGHPYIEWTDMHKSRLDLRELGVIRLETDLPDPRPDGHDADGRRVQFDAANDATPPDRCIEVVYPGRHGRPPKVLWFVQSALQEVAPPSQIRQRLQELDAAEAKYVRMQAELQTAKQTFAAQQMTWMEEA